MLATTQFPSNARSTASLAFVFTILLSHLATPVSAFGLTSYANLFIDPAHVLNNTWFDNSRWSRSMAKDWSTRLNGYGPWSVTNKTVLPRSGDPHDYFSYAVYFWPDCSKVGNTTELTPDEIATQCEYVQRDGVFNPDIHTIQNTEAINNLTDTIYLSALAYAATGDSTYSTRINDAIQTFFINETTRMNPNMNYAQVVRGPGSGMGKHTGVLDLKGITKVVSGIEIMRASGAAEWTPDTDTGMVAWGTDMVNWLTTSPLALQERAMPNNHATFYYNSLCSLYILLNQTNLARSALEEFYNSTFPAQILANGDQPFESIRTRPYHYRAYNLAALTTNAQIADYVNLSPPAWNRTTSANTTIFDALAYAMAQDPMTRNETDSIKNLNPTIAVIAGKFGDPEGVYAEFLKKTDPHFPGQPYFALNEGLSSAGIHQGLVETVYSKPIELPVRGWGSRT